MLFAAAAGEHILANAEKAWSSDAELVPEILAGSREHFDLLYETYFPRVFRFAVKRLGDPGEAEDVTQEVFVTVFRCLASYAGNSSLLVWIFGITRNKVNRRFRGRRPRLESLDDLGTTELAGEEVRPRAQAGKRHGANQLAKALSTGDRPSTFRSRKLNSN